MGFFSILGKIAYGAADFAAEAMEHTAKSIDRMSDEEIEKRHLKSAGMIRRDAVEMSDEELERKYSRAAKEVKKDASKMSKEELERKYSVSAGEMRKKAAELKDQAYKWQSAKEIRKEHEEERKRYEEEKRLREQLGQGEDDDFE